LPVLAVTARPPVAYDYEPTPVIPSEFTNIGLSFNQFFAIALAHKIATIAIVLLATLPMFVIVKFVLPRTYSATATLMVDSEISDRANVNPAVLASYQSTRIQLMDSPKVLMPVIEKLRLAEDSEYTSGYRGDPALLQYHVMDVLSKNLEIQPGVLGSEILSVTASAKSPIKAAEIANLVSEVYADQEPGPAAERAKRYAQQITELKSKVAAAQEQVTAFRQRTGVAPDLTAQNDVEATLLNTLEQRYQEAQNQRRAAEVNAGSEQTASSSFQGSVVARDLRAKVEVLEGQIAQLSSTLAPQHPKILELKSQLASTRRSLAAETTTFSTQTSADLLAARQLEAKLRAAVEEQRLKVLNFRKIQEEGSKYVLELESAQTVYKRALDGYDAIMFTSGGHGTNVKFVSRAVPPLIAAKPDKIKLMGAALVIGLFLGLIGPMAYELLFNRRIRCADDMERSFAVPVLIELDALPRGLSTA
jgi:polysaccharide biosynthesis transport protein